MATSKRRHLLIKLGRKLGIIQDSTFDEPEAVCTCDLHNLNMRSCQTTTQNQRDRSEANFVGLKEGACLSGMGKGRESRAAGLPH